jgi:hypothetical protein
VTRPWQHSPTYHAWPRTTPVIDAIATVVAVASVVIGAHAAIFLAAAVSQGDRATAIEDALFLVAIAVSNAVLDIVRHWRRHHGW